MWDREYTSVAKRQGSRLQEIYLYVCPLGAAAYPDYYTVKVSVFSFAKLERVDITLGPEMKFIAEVLGIDKSLKTAVYKGLLAAGVEIPVQELLLIKTKKRLYLS